jgi:hypothetical protein
MHGPEMFSTIENSVFTRELRAQVHHSLLATVKGASSYLLEGSRGFSLNRMRAGFSCRQ